MNYLRPTNVVAKSIELDSPRRPAPRWAISHRAIAPLAMACDAFIIYLAGVVAALSYHLFNFGHTLDFSKYAGLSAVVVVLFILVGQSNNRYDPTELLNFKSQLRQVTLDWLGIFLFVIAIGFSMKIAETFSRGSVFLFAATGFVALGSARAAWRLLLADGAAIRHFSSRNIALIADQSSAGEIIDALARHGMQSTLQILLPDHPDSVHDWEDAIGEAITSIRGSDVEEIIVSTHLDHWSALAHLFSRLKVLPLPVSLVPVGSASELLKLPARTIGDTITIELQRGPRTLFELVIKRTLDIVIASVTLIVSLPLLLLTAIAIKLDTRGPVLFRQRRRGFNGRQFSILKFRTMTVQEDGDQIVAAERKDLRITRVGRLLRRTSIDELPQLLNVLRGEMSVVGPRPHAVAHDIQFDNLVGTYAYRQHVKPGITGWAQVHNCRGTMMTVADIERRVKFDLWYINNWNLAVDFKILLMTVIEMFRGRNAY